MVQMQVNFTQKVVRGVAKGITAVLCGILFICANTNSSCLIHQPEVPQALEKYSKLR